MARAMHSGSIRPAQTDWTVVVDVSAFSRFWIDLACDNWTDGVLLVEVTLPGGPRREIARIPAAGWGGPFDSAMASSVVLSMATADSTATEAMVSVTVE